MIIYGYTVLLIIFMKKYIAFVLILCLTQTFSQNTPEIKIKTKVNEVTVFLESAQILRHKNIELKKGISILKFTDLSPFVDAKSIQVKAGGNTKVLAVNQQRNFLNKNKKSKVLIVLENKLKATKSKIILENTYLDIINQEIVFLKENRRIGGKNQTLTLANLKEISTFYGSKLTALKLKTIKRDETLFNLRQQKSNLENQIKELTNKKDYPTGEILVKIEAPQMSKINFTITYLVKNAGWFPSYDIRAKNINNPLELVYNANVRQNTKVDWQGVKLKFSSSNPNISGVAPKLKTYYLNYNTPPPVYNKTNNTVSGIVTDGNLPLPGVNVLVKGTTIGTTTDFDGRYTITVPNNSSQLVYSYIGMENKTIIANRANINVVLNESANTLDEVVITRSRGRRNKKSVASVLSGKVAGIQIRGYASMPKLADQINKINKQTTVEFEIKTPFSIKSSNKSYTVDMKGYQINANYQYYSVPKIDKSAFLLAQITNWEKYNLLDGEVNIFFEGAYVGKSLLDLRQATDTLQISLGRDKQVVVNREAVKKFATKQFIGNKKEETRAWKISVKNNKTEAINMLIFDQVPVSTLEEIKVDIQNISGAKLNPKNGKVKWEFTLGPNRKKDFNLRYSVKYPKYKNLIIE